MKKFELARAVAKKTGLTQEQVNKVVDEMSNVIVDACVEKGDEVNLPLLGKFKQKVNAAREGINPLNKQKIHIKESHTIKFTPTTSIKKVID